MAWQHEDPAIRNLAALTALALKADGPFINSDDGRTFTRHEFWQLTGRIAAALAAAGVVRGDRVALQADKSVEAMAVLFGCLRLGAVFLPLNPAYTPPEAAILLADAEPSLLIVAPRLMAGLATLIPADRLRTLDDSGGGTLLAATATGSFPGAPSTWDDLAAILYTSGTTGRSKGAMLTHGNLASNAVGLVDAWQFTADDVLLHALPVFHTHGLFVATNTALLAGARLIVQRRFDPQAVLAALPDATIMMGVPTFYTRLLEQKGLTQAATAHMRLFVSGSAPLLAETHRQFHERTGHAILERYGMTETNMITSNPYTGARVPGAVGLALPGVTVRIAEPVSGAELAAHEVGMIEVRGPNVFPGYWRLPDKTAEEFRADGFFKTGDLGSLDDHGVLTISGRAKDLIITGGFNVYPKEIEAALDGLAGVVESAVFGVPHPDFGEAVMAVVVASVAASADTESQFKAALASQLANFKCPKRIVVVQDLPRNAMGKVQKTELRRQFADAFQLPATSPPRAD